jgi:hypothetical protein
MTRTVINFPPVAEWVRAELDGGVISAGPRSGQPIYLVDMIDAVGGRLGIWDGGSYQAAREVLAECERDGLVAVDLLGEAL